MTEPCALVIGCGHMGERHARAWQQVLGVSQVAVVVRHEADRARAQRWKLPGIALVAPGELPQSLRFASVCTPTPTHFDVARPLVESGLSVLVEKPLCGRLSDAIELTKSGKVFVAHTCRAESTTRAALRAWGDAQPTRVSVHRAELVGALPPGTPPQAWHGRLLDVLVHDIATLLDILPRREPRAEAVWDDQIARLVVHFHWADTTLEIVEDQGAEDSERHVQIVGPQREVGWRLGAGNASAWCRQVDTPMQLLPLSWQEPTETLVREVIEATTEQRPSYIDADAGVTAMRWSAKALQALRDDTLGAPFSWHWVR